MYDNDASSPIRFEKVDCLEADKFCKQHNVTKLLELKYFANDQTDNNKMINFIQAKIDETLKAHEDEEAVKEKLSKGKSFVKFFSTNCPACQNMAEEWKKLENKYEKDDRLKIESVVSSLERVLKFLDQEYEIWDSNHK